MKQILFLTVTLILTLCLINCSSATNQGPKISDETSNGPEEENSSQFKIDPIPGLSSDFIRGMDISMLKSIEENGGKFYDEEEEKDAIDILNDHGVNYIRLRIWNNPEGKGGGNCSVDRMIDLAVRAKNSGMKVLVDFHYSDFWADPGKQNKPAA